IIVEIVGNCAVKAERDTLSLALYGFAANAEVVIVTRYQGTVRRGACTKPVGQISIVRLKMSEEIEAGLSHGIGFGLDIFALCIEADGGGEFIAGQHIEHVPVLRRLKIAEIASNRRVRSADRTRITTDQDLPS